MCAPLRGEPAPLLPLEVRYEASEGCPTGDELETELAARGLRHRAPGPGEAATRLTIRVRQGRQGSDGEAEVRQVDGGVSRRSLQGATCSEVLRSLTLVAALALSPFVTPAPSAPSSAASSAPGSPPAPVASTPPAAPSSSSPPAREPPRPPPEPPPRPAADPPATWAIGLEAGLTSELAPDVSPGAGLWVERRASAWPTLRLALGGSSGGTTDAGPYRASFRAYLAQASGCWPGGLAGRWTASACLELQGGLVTAEGSGAAVTRGIQRRAWVAPGAGARLGVRVLGRGRLEAAGALLVPLLRDQFVFEVPRVEAHQAGSVAWQAAIGAGVEF